MARKRARIGWVPMSSLMKAIMVTLPASARPTAGAAEDLQRSLNLRRGRRRRVGKLVIEPERLPLEGAHLVEGQHLHPFHVLHGRDEARHLGDVLRIVREAG